MEGRGYFDYHAAIHQLSAIQQPAVLSYIYVTEVMGEGHVGLWDLYGAEEIMDKIRIYVCEHHVEFFKYME